MIIYIDAKYICHTTNDGTRREFDVQFFDGKCKTLIEGYRYVPSGETWTDERGTEFHGEMIAPWKDYSALEIAQQAYEEGQINILTEVEGALGL